MGYNNGSNAIKGGTEMNKRDAVLSVIDPAQIPTYIPAAFFLHFDKAYHRNQAAVDRHLEFFRYTGMDFVKIQYEHGFPANPDIQRPEDWAKMPFYDLDFYAEPLKVVEGARESGKTRSAGGTDALFAILCLPGMWPVKGPSLHTLKRIRRQSGAAWKLSRIA
jgi:hypothetical protein